MANVQEIFVMMGERVKANPSKVANLKAAYLFELSGDGGGVFHAVFDNGAADIGEGTIPNPGCTVTISTGDFQAMVEGKLNPTAAFMSGKLKIKGDMGLAMKLQSVIS
ncbi:MAG TPA: SCP2 sterol-binding domain-containing protein [Symbiobacteriaceae bacterium]